MEHVGHSVSVCTTELVSVTYAATMDEDGRVKTDWNETHNEMMETQEQFVYCYDCDTRFDAEVTQVLR